MSVRNHAFLAATRDETRKRKRDDEEAIELDKRPFTISDPSNPTGRLQTLYPLALLSRAQLPLAFLDTSRTGSRLFAAHVHALEASCEHGDTDTTILVAWDENQKRLHAIERVKKRTYALCKLGTWVKEEDVRDRSKQMFEIPQRPQKKTTVQTTAGRQPWWTNAAVDAPARKAGMARVGLPKLAMQRVMDASPKDAKQATSQKAGTTPDMAGAGPMLDAMVDPVKMAPQDVLQGLARHYMEALYLSRVSLAYFAKGPLPRARAAFDGRDADRSTGDLIGFLRESILTAPIMDKKYRKGVLAIVKDLPARSTESPEKSKKRRRKRKWKPKRDKGGFFVGEDDHVEKWWSAADEETGQNLAESTEAEYRKRAPHIRTRETFVQIILTLEVLALEAAEAKRSTNESGAKGGTEGSQNGQEQQAESQSVEGKKPQVKKKQDLVAHLDTLVDKLCIWHSLEGHTPAIATMKNDRTEQAEPGNQLHDFCVEVIVPFYMSRIPRQAMTMNKKLGGPSASSPSKNSKAVSGRKPGEPAGRQAPEKKPRKPLARVSTDTLNHSKKTPPSLHRSATDTDLAPHIKREGSEPSLHSIPAINPKRGATQRPRPSLVHTLSSSHREIDLSAMSQANEAKARKKAEVQEKMRDAIATTRKPNRSMAVRELANSTDQSFAQATAKKASVSQPQQRDKAAQGVHVAATPFKHGVKATPYNDKHSNQAPAETVATTHVACSTTKPAASPYDKPPNSSFAVPQTGRRVRHAACANAVQETPSRGFARYMPSGLVRGPGTLDSPFIAGKPTAAGVQATPSRSGKRSQGLFGKVGGVPGTPSRSSGQAPSLVAASPEVSRKPGGREEQQDGAVGDVFQNLGWDDEEYEQLA